MTDRDRPVDPVHSPDPRVRRFEDVFAEVYEPLQRYVQRRVPRAVVDDVVSESLTVLWRRLESVPGDAALPWAYAVARRCISNQRRSGMRHDRLLNRVTARRVTEPVMAEPGVDGATDVDTAMTALPPADQELLQLWAWEQLAPREIAVVLGISANAVSIRLHRAKQRLKEELRKSAANSGQEQVGGDKEHHGR